MTKPTWMGRDNVMGIPVDDIAYDELKQFEDVGLRTGCIRHEEKGELTRKTFEFVFDTNENYLNDSYLRRLQIVQQLNEISNDLWTMPSTGILPRAVFRKPLFDSFYSPLCIKFNSTDYSRGLLDGVKFPFITSHTRLTEAIKEGVDILLSGQHEKYKWQQFDGEMAVMPKNEYQGIVSPFIRDDADGFRQLKVFTMYPLIFIDDCENGKLINHQIKSTQIFNYNEDICIGASCFTLYDSISQPKFDFFCYDDYMAKFYTGANGLHPNSTYSQQGVWDMDLIQTILEQTHSSKGVKVHHAVLTKPNGDPLTIDYAHDIMYYHTWQFSSVLYEDIGVYDLEKRITKRHYISDLNTTLAQYQSDTYHQPPRCDICGKNHIFVDGRCVHCYLTLDEFFFILNKKLNAQRFGKAAQFLIREPVEKALEQIIIERGGNTIIEQNDLLIELGVILGYGRVTPIAGDGQDVPRMINLNEEIEWQFYRRPNYPWTSDEDQENNSNHNGPHDHPPSYHSNLSESETEEPDSTPFSMNDDPFPTNSIYAVSYTRGPQAGLPRAIPSTLTTSPLSTYRPNYNPPRSFITPKSFTSTTASTTNSPTSPLSVETPSIPSSPVSQKRTFSEMMGEQSPNTTPLSPPPKKQRTWQATIAAEIKSDEDLIQEDLDNVWDQHFKPYTVRKDKKFTLKRILCSDDFKTFLGVGRAHTSSSDIETINYNLSDSDGLIEADLQCIHSKIEPNPMPALEQITLPSDSTSSSQKDTKVANEKEEMSDDEDDDIKK